MLRRTLAAVSAAAVLTALAACSTAVAGQGIRVADARSATGVAATQDGDAPARVAQGTAPSVTPRPVAPITTPTEPPGDGTGTAARSPDAVDATANPGAASDADVPGANETPIDAVALLARIRAASSSITSETVSVSVSGWNSDGPYSAQTDTMMTIVGGQIDTLEVSLTARDQASADADAAMEPTMVLRKVHDRVFIGPQALIAAVGIDDPQDRPWYEVTASTPSAIAALSDPGWDLEEWGAALPMSGEFVAAASTLTDLGPQVDGPAAHQYRMTVDIRTVPGLLDLTPEQTATVAEEGALLTAYLWLDDHDRTIRLIAGHNSPSMSLNLIESAGRFDEPAEIRLPRAGDIVTDC